MGGAIGAGITLLTTLIDKLFPDPEQAAKAKAMIMSAEFQPMLAQLEVNKAEAASGNMFVAGWRPFIGWGIGLTVVMSYGVGPFLNWLALWSFNGWGNLPPSYPTPDGVVLELLGGLLGLGVLRSVDKIKGVATTVIEKAVKK